MSLSSRDSETQQFLVAFGRRVRHLRLHRQLSQKRLAELAGVDRQTINRLENASRAITSASLCALAKALGVAPAELMPTDADYSPSTGTSATARGD